MKAQQYERKAHIIRDMDENIVFEGKLDLGALGSLPSINAAKREYTKIVRILSYISRYVYTRYIII